MHCNDISSVCFDQQETGDDEGPQCDGYGELCQGEVATAAAAMTNPLIRVASLGLQDYLRTLSLQHRLAARLKAARGEESGSGGQVEPPADNVLILVEHTPVYTTGMRTKAGIASQVSI